MENEISVIQNKIVAVRGQQVMIDRDIAELYGVETKRLNEQVKRNIERFPSEFCFQLSNPEAQELLVQSGDSSKSQFATLNVSGNRRGTNIKKLPYVFTEQGVAMLSAVLKSETAVKASIQIMKAFVAMRKFLLANAQVFSRLDSLEMHQVESDKKINELFCRMDKYSIDNTQGIFFQGQIFDAYAKFENFIAQAKKEIVLIDSYVDLSVLERLVTKKEGVAVTVYTSSKAKLKELDVKKFNEQYPQLDLKYTEKMHDRFMIIDGKILYHIGASLKDLGKKCFAFELLDSKLIADVLKKV
jgi:phage regulator Rha-like protein